MTSTPNWPCCSWAATAVGRSYPGHPCSGPASTAETPPRPPAARLVPPPSPISATTTRLAQATQRALGITPTPTASAAPSRAELPSFALAQLCGHRITTLLVDRADLLSAAQWTLL